MIILLLSLIFAVWFKYEISVFPNNTNCQTYNDIKMLYPFDLDLPTFLAKSRLQPKHSHLNNVLFIILPIIALTVSAFPIPLVIILFILTYLSQLDYYYYLTDIKYIAIIFLLSIYYLLFEIPDNLYENLFCFFIICQFFAIIIPLVNFVLKKSSLGLGDILLFIALSPLFRLEKMLLLILFSSLFGLLFTSLYWLKNKQKINRLPFIPFISISTFSLFLDKLPP